MTGTQKLGLEGGTPFMLFSLYLVQQKASRYHTVPHVAGPGKPQYTCCICVFHGAFLWVSQGWRWKFTIVLSSSPEDQSSFFSTGIFLQIPLQLFLPPLWVNLPFVKRICIYLKVRQILEDLWRKIAIPLITFFYLNSPETKSFHNFNCSFLCISKYVCRWPFLI